jgi:hypothetical protein
MTSARTRSWGWFILVLAFTSFAVSLVLESSSVSHCAQAPSGNCMQSWSTFPYAFQAELPAILGLFLLLLGFAVIMAGRETAPLVETAD